MTAHISHKYIESHWLVFAVQGIFALLFGCVALFTTLTELPILVAMASSILLILGIVEFFNLLHREHQKHGLATTAVIALSELAIAVALLLTIGQNVAWHVTIVAVYALLRGVFEIVNAMQPNMEATDRFAWLVCGVCGVLFGFAILNAGHLNQNTAFITYFGAYLMIFGVTNLFYGVHNRNEKLELIAERRLAAKKRSLAAKFTASKNKPSSSSKSSAKSAKRTSASTPATLKAPKFAKVTAKNSAKPGVKSIKTGTKPSSKTTKSRRK